MQCWRCGIELADLLLPLARAETSSACNADLHVCRMCSFFDQSVANACRETIAEPVKDKERANFCGYLQLNPGAYEASDGDAQVQARAKLAELFGETDSQTTSSPGSQSTLSSEGTAPLDAAEQARRKFEDLFKKN